MSEERQEQARALLFPQEGAIKEAYQRARRSAAFAQAARLLYDYTVLCRAAYFGGTELAALTIQSWDDELDAEQSGAQRCPGCGCARADIIYDDGLSDVHSCERCKGLYGVVTPTVLRDYVGEGWSTDEKAPQQYVDFMVLLPGGETGRVHGYVSSTDGRWIQKG